MRDHRPLSLHDITARRWQLFLERAPDDLTWDDVARMDPWHSALELDQLALWLDLTRQMLALRPERWVDEAPRVREAQCELKHRLQRLGDDGLRALPAQLRGIPLDHRPIPAAFRQNLTSPADRVMGTEQTLNATNGGAL